MSCCGVGGGVSWQGVAERGGAIGALWLTMCAVWLCAAAAAAVFQITNAPRGGGSKEVNELHEAVRALVKSMNSR